MIERYKNDFILISSWVFDMIYSVFVSHILVSCLYDGDALVGQNWSLHMFVCCVIMRLKYVLLLLGK